MLGKALWKTLKKHASISRHVVKGIRSCEWDEVLQLVSASLLYTVMKYGPDRNVGFSPIPAMSMLSHAAGSRFMQLMGGPMLSFYDWYADFTSFSANLG